LKPERWGSPLFQEKKYQEEKACDKRQQNNNNNNNNNNRHNNSHLLTRKFKRHWPIIKAAIINTTKIT
jgi:hypothetical protein